MPDPDRLYIDARVREKIEKMEKLDFLNAKSAKNKEIFLYAVARGLDAPSDIEGKKDGLLLEKDLNDADTSLIYGCIIPMTVENLDKISDKSYVYDYVQRCANTGFKIIDGLLDDGSLETLDKRLLSELDDRFDELGLEAKESIISNADVNEV